MADAFAVEVLTPERMLYAGAATGVVLRTSIGSMTVLAGHAPFVGDIVPGEVKVEREGEGPLRIAAHGGFLQVDTSPEAAQGVDAAAGAGEGPIPGLTTRVTVLLGIAEIADEIDLGRARQTLDQLRDSTEPEDQLAARRAETRLRVAEG